jgi:hypothetical protein
LNHYETLEELEQALDAITTSLMKCDFYHSLYDKFLRGSVDTPGGEVHEVFNTFNKVLPVMYADAVEVVFKAKEYFRPRNGLSKCSRDL